MFNSAEHYDRHVGRYNAELARALISFAGVRPGQRVLDVGCGPGALTRELATVVGADHVAAVDPSPAFAEACRARLPGVDVRVASAEELPFADASFDHALAQLVVNFMADAPAGVTQMRRVTRPGGRVSAATWDYASEMTFMRRFWDAAIATDPQAAAVDEAVTMRYCKPDELRALLEAVGLEDVAVSSAVPHAVYANFDVLWEPITGGIGPSGVYVRSLDEQGRQALKDAYRHLLGVGDAPFDLTARAWLACGVVPPA
jgi:ubiquinone/menaquinone biosynthesis C-methylase UbiE